MERKVLFTNIAKIRLEYLLDYLLKTWSYKVKKDFITKLDKSLDIIAKHPEIFPESIGNRGLRKCVITKQTSIFFRCIGETIYVLTVFDTRQEPKKLSQDF